MMMDNVPLLPYIFDAKYKLPSLTCGADFHILATLFWYVSLAEM